MKFVFEEEKPNLTLGDVKSHQFFIDVYDRLCIKRENSGYVALTTEVGTPWVTVIREEKESMPIKEIKPKVKKIEF